MVIRTKDAEREMIISSLSELFGVLSEGERAHLLACMTRRLYRKGEIIYREGDIPRQLLCLVTGKAKVYKDGVGRSQIVRVVKPVGYFGYRAAFSGQAYITEAAALEPALIVKFPLALVGATVYATAKDHVTVEGVMTIKKGKLRGYESQGMLCSGVELGVSEDLYPGAGYNGLLVLPDDAPVGARAMPSAPSPCCSRRALSMWTAAASQSSMSTNCDMFPRLGRGSWKSPLKLQNPPPFFAKPASSKIGRRVWIETASGRSPS